MTGTFAEPARVAWSPVAGGHRFVRDRRAEPAAARRCGGGFPVASPATFPVTAPAGHDFSRLRVYDGNRPTATPKDAQPSAPCSPTWFGSTDPEVDEATGKFTGKVMSKLNDAVLKDPCVRDCVREHEDVHVRRLTPIVERIHRCDLAAGNDWDKIGECNSMTTKLLADEHAPGECAAYRRSFTCLTLKLLDPASPCSKGASRDEIQKHRGYESCEMRNYCATAGTPELGVPNA
jgi:hypothetical protein